MGFRIPAPGFLRTGRGGSKPPGSPGWRPLPGSKAFGLQQPTGYHLFTIHSYLLLSPTQVGDAGRVRVPTYRYKVGSVIVCRHCPPLPPVSSTPVGAARSRPGRQVGDPYRTQKFLAYSNHRDTHLFTIHFYLFPSPTQVGDAGRVRELTYWYRVGSVTVSRHSSPRPWFPPCIKSGGLGN